MNLTKNILLACLIMAFSSVAMAQNQDKKSKKIVVTGTAEMEITPDEIFFGVSLKEYKDGTRKITIDQLEAQLAKAVKSAGIPKEDFQIENVYGYNWDWRDTERKDFLATKSYRIKLKDLEKANALISKIDPKGIQHAGVNNYGHSKMEDYKLEVKRKALKAAKVKAEYLLESLDEKLGRVIEINETPQDPMMMPMRGAMMMESADVSGGYQSNVDIKKIKVRAEISAAFEIQ